jgi:uncharacterized protein
MPARFKLGAQSRRDFLFGAGNFAVLAALGPGVRQARAEEAVGDWSQRLINAARAQIGVTVLYDPSYTKLAYPNGDVPRERGVCTDVVVRAYRDAFGMDLQSLVHEDMKAHFSAYPRHWSLSRPDASIDHRRVLNLKVYFMRRGAELGPALPKPADFVPGDLVTQMLPGNLPHIGIVSNIAAEAARFRVIHNIGSGVEETDILALYSITGRYRLSST